jgi:endonuclease YncB( thermonuclease family)
VRIDPWARSARKLGFVPGALAFFFRKKFLLPLLLGVLLGLYAYAPGKVVRVHDGDTVSLVSRERGLEKIRLYGVDAPEFSQPGGPEARAFLDSLLFLQEVESRALDQDQYGRKVAVLRLPDGRGVNEELLRAGWAWYYGAYCREAWCPAWKLLELEARKNKRGLWAGKSPVPPWQWRREKRNGG